MSGIRRVQKIEKRLKEVWSNSRTSCCIADSERPHRCRHLANNFYSCRIFFARYIAILCIYSAIFYLYGLLFAVILSPVKQDLTRLRSVNRY